MDKKNELVGLGKRIKEIRKAKGYTQVGLAQSIGKDHPSINRLERGKTNPTYIFLLEIANGLDVEISSFFHE